MKKNLLVLLCTALTYCVAAQEYNVFLIPDSLRKGADVVKRTEEYILTIHSPARYTVNEKYAYTILNAAAASYAKCKTYYDKFCSINSVYGKLYNSMGKELKHSKKSDWKDYSVYDGYSLLSDDRYKENEFYSAEYPYTVEYEEEDDINGTMNFPDWMPQSRPFMSVQKSSFTIVAPQDYKVRYKPLNYSGEPVITKKGNTITYTWQIANIPAKKQEALAPPFNEIAPSVIFAPSQFEVQGYKGDMSTWDGYGKFMYQLIKGRDVLPDDSKRKVHELTDHLKSDREKINVLYDYLQKNTRYISIQLGIGGWQPFEAAYVAEKKYGDCKALSNFMMAMLKEAGITAKYIEIYGDASPPAFIEDFPGPQANHVITCVPLGKDTVWLECTDQTKSPGYMGSFTGNRKAILIDENGGKIVNTPSYLLNDNLQVRRVKATADAEGNLMGEINSIYTGLQQDFPHALMNEFSKEERAKYLNQMFSIPTYEVLKNEYKEHRGTMPSMEEMLQVKLSNYATVSGKRLFINPNIFSSSVERLFADTARKFDCYIKNAYRDIDSVEIKIPAGYKPESVPKDTELSAQFGKYKSSVKVQDDKIIYYRMMEQYSGRFPAKDYNDLVKFREQISKADRAKLVLVKND